MKREAIKERVKSKLDQRKSFKKLKTDIKKTDLEIILKRRKKELSDIDFTR